MKNNEYDEINNFVYKIGWSSLSMNLNPINDIGVKKLAVITNESNINFYDGIKKYINSKYPKFNLIWLIIGDVCQKKSDSVYIINLYDQSNLNSIILSKKVTDIVLVYNKDSTVINYDPYIVINSIWEQTKILINLLDALPNEYVPRVTVITEAASPIFMNNSLPSLVQSTLWSAGRVIKLEFSEIDLKFIDLKFFNDIDFATITEEIFYTRNIDVVSIDGSNKYIPRLIKYIQHPYPCPIDIKHKTFLVTGGTGALGLIIAEWLATNGAKDILLIARTHPDIKTQNKLQDIRKFGANVKLYHIDISDESSVDNLFNILESEGYILNNIIHAAGVIHDVTYRNLTIEDLKKVLLPKVIGIVNIYTNLKKRNITTDKLIMFSSATSIIGNLGQMNYAIANAFLDNFSYVLNNEGINTTSINWGVWNNTGMSGQSIAKSNLESSGFKRINKNEGLKVLDYVLRSQNLPQIGVIPMDWRLFLSKYKLKEIEYYKNVHLDDNIIPQHSNICNNFSSTSGVNELKLMVKSSISEALGTDVDDISDTTNLIALGMDSLSAVSLKHAIYKITKVNLSLNHLYQFKDFQEMLEYIAKEVQ